MPSANSRSNFVTDSSLYINYEGTKVDTGLVFNTDKWHTVGISFNEETVISEFDEISPVVCPLRATNSNATRLICLCLRSPKKKDLCKCKGLGMAHPNGFVVSKANVIAIVTRSVNRVYGNKVHCVLCVSALQNLLILPFCCLCPLRATNSNAMRLICLCLRSPKKKTFAKRKGLGMAHPNGFEPPTVRIGI